jgi:hypothetical protein
VLPKAKAQFRGLANDDLARETSHEDGLGSFMKEMSVDFAPNADRICQAMNVARRSEAMLGWANRGAAVVIVNYHSDRVPHAVAGPCRQDHVLFVRLVVPVVKGTGP